MPGEGREELVRRLEKLAGERRVVEGEERTKQQDAAVFERKVMDAFFRIKLPLEQAVGLLKARGQEASLNRREDVTLVLLATIDGKQSQLIFEGEEATGKVNVNCRLADGDNERLNAYPPDEITPAVVEPHLDHFYQGLAFQLPG